MCFMMRALPTMCLSAEWLGALGSGSREENEQFVQTHNGLNMKFDKITILIFYS